MTALVTIEEVDTALRLDLQRGGSPAEFTDSRVPHIEMLIEAASAAVLAYIKASEDDVLDMGSPPSAGSPPLYAETLPRIKWATIMLVGYWFRNPDADPDKDFERGYLPKPVTALLYDLRQPTVA